MSSLSKLLNLAITQNYHLDNVISKAKESLGVVNSLIDDGDRVWFCYIDKFDFQEKNNKVQDLNFNISGDSDFFAQRISFAIKINRNGETAPIPFVDPPGEFRTTFFNYDGIIPTSSLKIDFQFELTESYADNDGKPQVSKYQNQPIPSILSFAHNNPFFGSPSGMHFDIDWPLKRNSVLQCKVNIISAINELNSAIEIDNYRFIGILEGYKRVRGIK